MTAPFTPILKITILPKNSNFEKLEFDDSEVNRFAVGGHGIEFVKNLEKLKSQKLFKSRKLAKSKKKTSKSGYLPNFNVTEIESNFLTPTLKRLLTTYS